MNDNEITQELDRIKKGIKTCDPCLIIDGNDMTDWGWSTHKALNNARWNVTQEEMSVGSLVKYKKGNGILYCGTGIYPQAVVASITPFVLISEEGDMKWTATVTVSDFEVCGVADQKAMLAMINRLIRDSTH